MTTKVVKGSLWTLAGQVAPLAVSLVTTPFTIRMLGTEGYGTLVLISMLPTYLSFTDFGMGIASTKFAAEAYAQEDAEKEAIIVRTAAFFAFIVSFPFVLVSCFLSENIVEFFNVPFQLQGEATIGLRLTLISFGLSLFSSIFNSPQLSRLRMSTNAIINGGFRSLGIVCIPFVVYFGYGLTGVGIVLVTIAIVTLISQVIESRRLNPFLLSLSIDLTLTRSLVVFGGSLAIGGIAGVLLSNLEKTVLPKLTNIADLAYFSIAATLASMTTLLPQAMVQSMIPAFSRLQNSAKLKTLVSQLIRLNVAFLLPILVFLTLVASTVFDLWAGSGFGEKSSPPFYFLLVGFFFNVLSLTPLSVMIANGQTPALAKIYWVEIIPYIVLVSGLTSYFGIIGTSVAWMMRLMFDFVLIGYFGSRPLGFTFREIRNDVFGIVALVLISIVPAAGHFLIPKEFRIVLIIVTLLAAALYVAVTWKFVVRPDEKLVFLAFLGRRFGRPWIGKT